jgi:hypothetical protein
MEWCKNMVNEYNMLARKCEVATWRTWRAWEDSVNIRTKEICLKMLTAFYRLYECGNEPSLSVKGREFPAQLSA